MASPVVALDHVQVAAPPGCEEAARRFYGDLLGLREIVKPPALASRGGVWFRRGDGELLVGVADEFVPAAKAHPGLRLRGARDLEALAERLRRSGAEVDPDERIPGQRRFFTRDPWGNRLELLAR